MSKRGWSMPMDKGYPLPEDHLPEGRVCVQFEIPDDQTYAADVIGHIMELGKWWNWEKAGGADRRATEAAQLFRTAIHETLCVEKYREMGCRCEDKETFLHRLTADGQLQISKDGGATWVQDPDDPRITGTALPPLPEVEGHNRKCDSATNALERVQDAVGTIANGLATNQSIGAVVLTILGAIALIIFSAGTAAAVLTPIVISLAAAIINKSKDDYLAEFDNETYDKLLCILNCRCGPDGTYTDQNYRDILTDIDSQFTGDTAGTFTTMIIGWGVLGLNNAARSGAAPTGDCSGCDCGGCDATWVKGNVDGNIALGTVSAMDADGYVTVTSELYSDGANYATMLTTDETKGCIVLDIVPITNMPSTGTAAARIVLPATQHVGNITNGNIVTTDTNYNYIAWNSGVAFQIKILFG